MPFPFCTRLRYTLLDLGWDLFLQWNANGKSFVFAPLCEVVQVENVYIVWLTGWMTMVMMIENIHRGNVFIREKLYVLLLKWVEWVKNINFFWKAQHFKPIMTYSIKYTTLNSCQKSKRIKSRKRHTITSCWCASRWYLQKNKSSLLLFMHFE